jgi:phospholipase C
MPVIDHFVVLMLENRSFDSMLGCLKSWSPEIDGLTLNEFNDDAAQHPIKVWNSGSTSMCIPSPDPGESWRDMNVQLFGAADPPPTVPGMSGFVRNYESQTAEPPYPGNQVMHYYSEEQLPVLTGLAKQFALSDRWHASAPCQTWPNRFFLHTGTAGGHENNDPAVVPFARKTIFEQFDAANIENGWKIYYHDIPQTLTLKYLWGRLDRFRYFDEFLADAAAGTLPAYSFIEPRYFQEFRMPNDQHPPHNVTLGEQLISDVYGAVRQGPLWKKTLLVIIYDEHGGCFDHVPPPAATAPDPPPPSSPFAFDRYGVRVPAVLVSQWIAPGTLLRPPGLVPFDHTSVLRTLSERFGFEPLTARVAAAPDVLSALSLPEPTNDGPEAFAANPFTPTPIDVALAALTPANGLQRSLLHMAQQLPRKATPAAIESHIQELEQGTGVTLESIAEADAASSDSLYTAVAAARARMAKLFASAPGVQTTNQGGP